jgi:hypothetical protein
MLDMIFVLVGSVIVSVIAVIWFRHHTKCDLMKGKPCTE